jgi:hypothetical protein
MCTAISYARPVSRGLGATQRGILGELSKLPIEAYPGGIPVVKLAERLGCGDRQVRRAAYSLAERGLVALVKQPRPGRQGLSLFVWDPRRSGCGSGGAPDDAVGLRCGDAGSSPAPEGGAHSA